MSAPRWIDLCEPSPDWTEAGGAIGIGEAIEPQRVVQIAMQTGLRHIVQRDGYAFASELASAQTMLSEPELFFVRPLEVIFGADSANYLQRFKMVFNPVEHKNEVLKGLDGFLASVPQLNNLRQGAMAIADELYTNGAKSAWEPPARFGIDPPTRGGSVEFFAAADLQRLLIGCRDTFGCLEVPHLLSRINGCYEKGVAGSINVGQGGAGIGSFMLFDSCVSYFAGVKKNVCSVVCVALPIGVRQKAVSGLSKNIHLIP